MKFILNTVCSSCTPSSLPPPNIISEMKATASTPPWDDSAWYQYIFQKFIICTQSFKFPHSASVSDSGSHQSDQAGQERYIPTSTSQVRGKVPWFHRKNIFSLQRKVLIEIILSLFSVNKIQIEKQSDSHTELKCI